MLYKLGLLTLSVLLYAQADDDFPRPPAGPRIVGGYKVSNRADFAYQVSIRYRDQHFCGGTIIDENHVLTAAHCCYDKDNILFSAKTLTVVAGDLNIRKASKSTVKVNVKYLFPHADYSPKNIANDIAVLRIKGTFGGWNSNIQPLQLANTKPPPLTFCKVSGWGALRFEDENIPSELYAADVNLFDQEMCKRSYRNKIKAGMICAGRIAGGVDSCQGDSGGPLAYNKELVGVVSWGYECAKPGAPGVYTDVSYYLSWIAKQQTKASSGTFVVSTLSIVTALILHLLRFE